MASWNKACQVAERWESGARGVGYDKDGCLEVVAGEFGSVGQAAQSCFAVGAWYDGPESGRWGRT